MVNTFAIKADTNLSLRRWRRAWRNCVASWVKVREREIGSFAFWLTQAVCVHAHAPLVSLAQDKSCWLGMGNPLRVPRCIPSGKIELSLEIPSCRSTMAGLTMTSEFWVI